MTVGFIDSRPLPRLRPVADERLDSLKFTLVFAALTLNSLAKLSPPLYAALLGGALLLLGLDLARRPFRLGRSQAIGMALVAAYLVFAGIAFLHALNTISLAGALVGLGRFLFAIPLLAAALVYIRSVGTLKRSLVGIAVVVAVGNLSIPYQLAFGEIEWLGSDYVRGGFDRYASLLGNVTAIGIAAGFYFSILLLLMKKGLWRTLLLLAIVLTALASLSKAALFNLIIPVVVIAGMGLLPPFRTFRRVPVRAIAGFGVLTLTIIGIAATVPAIQGRVLVNLASFGLADESKLDDVTIATSFQERLLKHPSEVYRRLTILRGEAGLLTGAGFGMSSTALVPQPDELSIMAHNQFVEFVALSGILYLFVFLAIMIAVFVRLGSLCVQCWREGQDEARRVHVTLLVVYACYAANLPFANGLVYQPMQAAVFWIFCAIQLLPRSALMPQGVGPARSPSSLPSSRD